MTVAIVGGTGDLGFGIALRLARIGERVVIGSREAARGAEAAAKASELAGAAVDGTDNATAISEADLSFVTVPFRGQAEIYRSIKDAWPDGALVCDTTTPLATAVGGRPTHVLRPWHGSAAEQAKSLLPKGARLAAGFHSVGAEPLSNIAHPMHGDVLLCGDPDAKAAVGALVERIPDLRWVDVGRLEMARVIEPLTAMLISVNRAYGLKDTGVRLVGRDAWGAPDGG